MGRVQHDPAAALKPVAPEHTESPGRLDRPGLSHQVQEAQALGPQRGGRRPDRLEHDGGNCHANKLVEQMLESVRIVRRTRPTPQSRRDPRLDKGYDFDDIRELVISHPFQPHIRNREEELSEHRRAPTSRAEIHDFSLRQCEQQSAIACRPLNRNDPASTRSLQPRGTSQRFHCQPRCRQGRGPALWSPTARLLNRPGAARVDAPRADLRAPRVTRMSLRGKQRRGISVAARSLGQWHLQCAALRQTGGARPGTSAGSMAATAHRAAISSRT